MGYKVHVVILLYIHCYICIVIQLLLIIYCYIFIAIQFNLYITFLYIYCSLFIQVSTMTPVRLRARNTFAGGILETMFF